MRRKYSNRECVLGGLFALLAAFPLVTSSDLDVPLAGSVSQETINRAYDDQASQSVLRRMRWTILRDCAQREALGEANVCPDMNDTEALRNYWNAPAEEEEISANEAIGASIEDLGSYETHILRRARRNGQCPEGLDALVPGFQELCDRTVAEGTPRRDAIQEAVDSWVGAPNTNR